MKTPRRRTAFPPIGPLARPPERRARRRSPVCAFTLIELLVVMGIIALLVALLFPAIGAARQAANRARAEQEAKSIETAVKSYLNEYGKYPLQNGTNDTEYTGASYSSLIATLRGLDLTNNARRIVFLEAAEGSITNNVMLDPWDLAYRVMADWSFNNTLESLTQLGSNLAGRTVAVWSKGPDGKDGNATERQDDVVSWGK